MVTIIDVTYINDNQQIYTAEENIIGDYYLHNNVMEFDSKGSKIIIPYANVKSIKIYEEEKIHGKEKERTATNVLARNSIT